MKEIDEETVDDDIIGILENIDHIDLTELSSVSSYDDLRYSVESQVDPHTSFPVFNESVPQNLAFALNFSSPSCEFKEYVDELIENTGQIGVNIDDCAEQLAETALEAGEIGLKIQGGLGYVLMSDIDEEYDQDTFEKESDIPGYFLDKNGLNSKYYWFEGALNEGRDLKVASVTEDTTAIAWFIGRVLGEFQLEGFDIGEDFKDAYDQTVERYIRTNYPGRL